MLEETKVALPPMDKVMGVTVTGVEVEIQWKSAGPALFPKPEDLGRDALYTVQLSTQSAETLTAYLLQYLSSIGRWPPKRKP